MPPRHPPYFFAPCENLPKRQHHSVEIFLWRKKRDFRAVGNGMLWLTPCKLARERSLETGQNIVANVGHGRSW